MASCLEVSCVVCRSGVVCWLARVDAVFCVSSIDATRLLHVAAVVFGRRVVSFVVVYVRRLRLPPSVVSLGPDPGV